MSDSSPDARRISRLGLAAVIVAGLLLRIGHWGMAGGSDDSRYMNYAALMAHGEHLATSDVAAARLGYEAFLAGAMLLFGESVLVCSAAGLAVFAGEALLLWLLTAALADESAALVAVALFALLPLDIVNATAVLPDGLMTLLALGACLLYVKASRAEPLRRQLALFFAFGVAVGLGITVKETTAFVAAAAALHFLIVDRRRRRWPAIAAVTATGVLAVLALEMIGLRAWTGDPFYSFHSVGRVYGEAGVWHTSRSLRDAALYYVRLGLDPLERFGVHFYLLLAAGLVALLRKDRAVLLPALVIAALGLYLSVGFTNPSTLTRVPQIPRYFQPVLAFGCILAGAEAAALMRGRRWARAASLAGVLVLGGISLKSAHREHLFGITWSGIAPVARWLEGLDARRKEELAVPESFVQRLALEYRDAPRGTATIRDEDIAPGSDLVRRLAGRGLVIPVFWRYRTPDGIEGRLTAAVPDHLRVEVIDGPVWPPYAQVLGVGGRRRAIGRIYWPKEN